MRYTALPTLEAKFRQTGNNGEYAFKKVAVPVPGEALTLNALFATPAGRSGYYYDVAHPKQRIVIHFTAGNIRSDMGALTRNNYHVSVPFVIGRDGTIYQLFSSRHWSGHIGKGIGNLSGNAQDKATIGIELSNYGYLSLRDGNLETYYSRLKDAAGNAGPVDVYCALNETAAFKKIDAPFRQQQYYATHTPEQYDSLIILLRYLTATYAIPRVFLPEAKRFLPTQDVLQFKGIVSHVNYRESGKWDIGPAFDWDKVVAGVQAASYQTMFAREATMERSIDGEGLIVSESEIEAIAPAAKDAALEDEPYDETAPYEEEKKTKTKQKLYALIVGIDDYPRSVVLEGRVSFPPLRGCVADANKMAAYLKSDKDFNSHIKLLTNADASKAAVVAAFSEHLGKAGKDDIALFYFSGHGTQEIADRKIWTADTDGKLECIVCHYNKEHAANFLLADKELRFLIHQLAQKGPHVVTLFDCCHSGDATRNGQLVTAAFEDVVEKRVPFAFSKRTYEDFVFAQEIMRETILQNGEAEALPQGAHVQISACESDESAVEVSGEGVFTKTLIQVLEASGGAVTYSELRSRVRQYLRNAYEQKPRIYVPEGSAALLHQNFLKKQASRQTVMGEIMYNAVAGWVLNRGAVHGVDQHTTVYITDEDGNEAAATVGTIKIDHAEVLLRSSLDTAKVYKAALDGLLAAHLPIHVANTDGTPQDQEALMQTVFDSAKSYIIPEEVESKAAYTIHNRNGVYYFTHPLDAFRPLVAPQSSMEDEAATVIAGYARHISQWHFLKDLQNESSRSRLPQDVLQITLMAINNGAETPIDTSSGGAAIALAKANGRWQGAISVKITNTTDQNIYCCALYLTSQFAAYAGMLQPNVYLLGPGQSVQLQVKGKTALPVAMDEVHQWYNHPFWEDHFKFIYSTEEFDTAALSLDALPQPPVPGERSGSKKSIAFEEKEEAVQLSGWATQLLTLRFENPAHNQISDEDLSAMLNNEATADFALGLYFDPVVEGLATRYELKPEIEIISTGKEALEKSFVQDRAIDLANWWARRRRNKHYEQMIKRFPDRMRIVSEGDSWFQHPLVLDTIDHLSRVYPIYCVAAAGDTLRNYVSAKKKAGDFYLDALEEHNPDVFLISGGGNDILGAQFRGYLNEYKNDNLPEGTQPERFLKNALLDELAALKEIYRALFADLQTNKPDLKILVHGYDYPIKLDEAKKGWLGRYMIEKGIRAGDRRAVIRYIMDAFNKMLLELAIDFDNITYIDVRNIVRYDVVNGPDQWYDEIHPNNEGFQQVAMKFLARINEFAVKKKSSSNAPIRERPGITINTKHVEYETDPSIDWEDVFKTSGRGTVLAGKLPGKFTLPKGLEFDGPTAGASAPQAPPATASSPSLTAQQPALPLTRTGFIDYDVPGVMQLGSQHRCKVKIGGDEVAKALLKTGASSVHEEIKIGEEMSVCLIDSSGGKYFSITTLSVERQLILPGEATSWNFAVTPLLQGRFPLALRVTIHLKNSSKDLDILEKEVVVASGADAASADGAGIRRVLFLAANPSDMERLNITKESSLIQEELERAPERKVVFTMNMAVTPRNLVRYILKEDPEVVHFSGHGAEDGICIESEGGAAKMVDAETLDALFSEVKDKVKCVVLNACYSEAQAGAIAKHIKYVVGMKRSVKDKAAQAFAAGFYMALADGEDIKKAFKLGLVQMRLEQPGQEAIPVLIENGG